MIRMGNGVDITKYIHRYPAYRREKNVQVRPRDQFRKHAAGLFEQGAPQCMFIGIESFCYTRQVPDRLDCNLGNIHLPCFKQHLAIGPQVQSTATVGQLRNRQTSTGHCYGGTDVDAVRDVIRERTPDEMAPRIDGYDFLRVRPLRVGAQCYRRGGVCQIRFMQRVQAAGCNGQGAVDRVGPRKRPDCIARCGPGRCCNYGPASLCIRCTPV